ncbi:hypothetical protein [Streptomyces sp. NPDC058985]|uniref:hypothetical protein n=1 Tax=Streptomyces sp. NPDC058985 TaxID=3346684 RepID=UPI0036A57443
MTSSATHNGRIPTDPATALALLLALVYATSQLTPDQANALIATLGVADAGMRLIHLTRGSERS